MSLIRHGNGKFDKVKSNTKAGRAKHERSWDDPDLEWGREPTLRHCVYLLGANETFDPHTSSKGSHDYDYIGPSLIHVEYGQHRTRAIEYYVNDPEIWKWIRKSIAQQWLSSKTIVTPPSDVDENRDGGF